jgi:hypothetical protein
VTATSTRSGARTPGSSRSIAPSERAKSAAPTSATSEQASCATTSVRTPRRRAAVLPRAPDASTACSPPPRRSAVPRSAGSTPARKTVTAASVALAASTRQSTATLSATGSSMAGIAAASSAGAAVAAEHAERAAGRGQHHRLGGELAHQPPPPGAEGRAHAELPSARDGTREQKVGDVRAHDELHEQRGRAEHAEQRGDHALPHPLAERERDGDEAVALRVRRRDAQPDRPQFGVERGAAHARQRTRQRHEPVGIAALELLLPIAGARVERDRQPEVEGEAGEGAGEARRRHADHRTRHAVHPHRAPDHGRVGGVAATPERVGEHHHRRAAGRGRLLAVPEAAERRAYAERGEVLGARVVPPHALGGAGRAGAGVPHAELLHREGGDAGHPPRAGAPVDEIRVRERPVAAEPRVLRPQVHEPARVAHKRQRVERDPLEPGERRRVRADAERDREDDDEGERGRAPERAGGGAEVAEHGRGALGSRASRGAGGPGAGGAGA